MNLKQQTDVVVVGAGPVGLFTALALARQGVAVQVIDEEWRTGAHSYALALHPQTLKLLGEVGLMPALLEAGKKLHAINYYASGKQVGRVDFGKLETPHPYLLTVPQCGLEELLERRLTAAGRAVHWEHRFTQVRRQEGSVIVTVDQLGKETTGYAVHMTEWVTEATRWIDAGFLIGADGHRSGVRRVLGTEFEAIRTPKFYALFEFECPGEFSEAGVSLDEGARAVFWPLPAGKVRWSFEINDDDIPPESRLKSRLPMHVGSQIYPYLTREDLVRLLGQRAPWFTAEVGRVTWSLGVRFDQRLAREFGSGRVWLVGDAAHQADPVGVQSLNRGIAEGADLALRVAAVLHEHAPLEMLHEYNQHWTGVWRQVFGMGEGATSDGEASAWAVAHAAELPAAVAGSGDDLGALLGQLHLRWPAAAAAGRASGA